VRGKLSSHLIAHSCSLILLVKCNVLEALIEHFKVVIPEAVLKETTSEGIALKHPDAALIAQYVFEEKIKVVTVNRQNDILNIEFVSSLGDGEREVLLLSRQQKNSVVATDDGKAIKICRYFGIPFIISPKIVSELYRLDKIDAEKAKTAIQKLRIIGRYSPDIIAEAIYQLEEIARVKANNR
jgi:predicted nucleic acid-binding protein